MAKVEKVKKVLKGQATKEQVDAWKKEWPLGVCQIVSAGSIGYFHRPGLKEMDFYNAKSNTEGVQVSEQWKALVEVCFLGGDEDFCVSAKFLPTAHAFLKGFIFDAEAELVNL